jgi:hypothetical protein
LLLDVKLIKGDGREAKGDIRARYDDYKMEFYKKCSKDFTEKWIEIIKELRAWLKENLLKQQ